MLTNRTSSIAVVLAGVCIAPAYAVADDTPPASEAPRPASHAGSDPSAPPTTDAPDGQRNDAKNAAKVETAKPAGGRGDLEHPDRADAAGVPLHGFASVGFGLDNQKEAERRRGYARRFSLDNLILYFAPDLGRVRFLGEVAFEPGWDDNGVGLDLERLQLGYTFANWLTAYVGKFHTPLGFHITSFHHGGHMMTALDKPEFLDFEDHKGVLPVHTVGTWLTGQVNFGVHRFGYMAFAGNGNTMAADGNITTLGQQNFTDGDRDWLMGTRVNWSFGGALQGLMFGATAATMRVEYVPDTNATTPNVVSPFAARWRTFIGHLVYDSKGFEFHNEFHFFKNTATFSDGTPAKNANSWAGYSQVAYWITGAIAPFARVERGNYSSDDLYFMAQSNGLTYSKVAAGLRYNLSSRMAVKVEGSTKKIDDGSPSVMAGTINTIRAQVAIRF